MKMEIEHFKYPKDMDKECIEMCDIFNTLGLSTKFSCCGHGEEDYSIMFEDDITEDNIVYFLNKFSNKDYTPLLGGFQKWVRKLNGKIVGNWSYSVPNQTWADIDRELIKDVFFSSSMETCE